MHSSIRNGINEKRDRWPVVVHRARYFSFPCLRFIINRISVLLCCCVSPSPFEIRLLRKILEVYICFWSQVCHTQRCAKRHKTWGKEGFWSHQWRHPQTIVCPAIAGICPSLPVFWQYFAGVTSGLSEEQLYVGMHFRQRGTKKQWDEYSYGL